MKKSELLRQATLHLKCNDNRWLSDKQKSTYICSALKLATRKAGGTRNLWDVCDSITHKIEVSLEGFGNVECWLDAKGYSTNLRGVARVNAFQSYRLAWMRELIREFEEKGE